MCLSSKHGYGSDSLHTLKSSLTTGYQSTAQALLAKKVSSSWQFNVRGQSSGGQRRTCLVPTELLGVQATLSCKQ